MSIHLIIQSRLESSFSEFVADPFSLSFAVAWSNSPFDKSNTRTYTASGVMNIGCMAR